MNLENIVLKEIYLLENNLKCNICHKGLNKPVRLKICGHYFCQDCLENNKLHYLQLCPKCESSYQSNEVETSSIAQETTMLLLELKQIFQSMDYKPNNPVKEQELLTDIIHFKKRKYHLNYVNMCCKKNAKGETPLHIACKKRNIKDVLHLLDKNVVDINSSDFAGWVPLHEAIESKSYEIVETLLEHGALIDIPGQDYTSPLHKAATLEDENMIRLLLQYGATKNCYDYFGKRPIDFIQNLKIRKIFDETFEHKEIVHELYYNNKISVYCYYVDEEYKEKLKIAKVNIEEEYVSTKITHFIIKKTHKPSVKIFQALLEGCMIVPQEWINNFLKGNYFVPLPTYEYIFNQELNSAIQKAMMNFSLKLPKLFDGIKFAIVGHKAPIQINNIKLTKDSLTGLIKAGGGKVLHRAPTPRTCDETENYPYHSNITKKSRCCHFIIYDEDVPPTLQYQMAEIKHRSSKWLLNCILKFTILD